MSMPSGAATALAQPEGVALAHALVARLAEDCGVRALAIKGPVSAHHGWRQPRLSSDADVLVEPTGLRPLLRRLEELGWEQRPQNAAHSVTLWHRLWPCELDIHDHFPGFLSDPRAAFGALWESRSTAALAGYPQPCTGPAASAVVAALHALREPENGRHQHELEQLVERLRTQPQLCESIQDLAQRTGAAPTLAPLYEQLGWPTGGAIPAGQAERYAAWELRRETGRVSGVALMLRLRTTPVLRWPALLPEVLLGHEDVLRTRFPQAPPARWAPWSARWWRVPAGVRDLPKAFMATHRYVQATRGHQ